jgi:hypothetical protein
VTTEDDIDTLFELPPDRFTAARDELAKRTLEAGDKAKAAEIKKLRKPTVVAWALNQLARRHRAQIEDLIEAGQALRDAQRKALSGVKSEAFREATGRRRKLVQVLTKRGLEIMREAGRGPQGAEEEIGRWLESASSVPKMAETLLEARLSKLVSASVGFESVITFEVVDGEGAGDEADRKAKETAIKNAERQAEQAEAEARRARIRADTLGQDLEELTRRSREAAHEAEKLEEAAIEARDRLERTRGS